MTDGPVAKAFNLNFATAYEDIAAQRVRPGQVWCGDPEARQVTERLIRDAGYEPVAAGDLENARALTAKGGAAPDHTLTVLAFASVGDDPDEVARALHPHIEGHAAWLGRPQDEVFTVAGPASQAAGRIAELAAAGADTVVLRIAGAEPLRQLEALLEAAGRRG